jgi:hypothetical protein
LAPGIRFIWKRIAVHVGQSVQLAIGEGLGKLGGLRGHAHLVGRHLHHLPQFAHLKLNVHMRNTAGVHRYAGLHGFLEAGAFCFHAIDARQQEIHQVISGGQRNGTRGDAGLFIHGADFDDRHVAPGRVGDGAGDPACINLRER